MDQVRKRGNNNNNNHNDNNNVDDDDNNNDDDDDDDNNNNNNKHKLLETCWSQLAPNFAAESLLNPLDLATVHDKAPWSCMKSALVSGEILPSGNLLHSYGKWPIEIVDLP